MIRFSLLVLLSVSALFAQIQFPHGSGVVDITKPPYNAKSDGKSDVTEIIQQALDDHANGDYIIYLPIFQLFLATFLQYFSRMRVKTFTRCFFRRRSVLFFSL